MGRDLPLWRCPEAVASSVVASRLWWRNADLPDVINHADAEWRPDLLAEAIDRRMRHDTLFGMTHLMRLPKPSGGVRVITSLDPVDELAYRQSAGRVARRVAVTLHSRVNSSRPVILVGTWKAEDWRQARPRHVDGIAAERGAGTWDGVGKLDVARHYPTVALGLLRLVLHAAACQDNAVRDLIELVASLQERSHCPGLAIGPEASALLGTVALAPLDRMLDREGVVFLRWVDDVLLFVSGEDRYEEVKALAATQLAVGEQSLNLVKSKYERFDDDPVVGLEDLYGVWETSGGWSSNPGAELSKLAEAREIDGVSRVLGQLRYDGNPGGIAPIVSDPWLIATFPTQVGAYLRRVRGEITDWDRITSMIFDNTTDENVAGQLRLARLLEQPQIGAQLGSELFERGKSLDRSRYAPLANELLAAAGRGQEKLRTRQSRGANNALEFADLNARRALLDSCRREKPVRAVQATLKHLAIVEPDLAALLDLIAA